MCSHRQVAASAIKNNAENPPASETRKEQFNPDRDDAIGSVTHKARSGSPPAPAPAIPRASLFTKDRFESSQEVTEHYNSDPFALSTKIRKRFREEKKVEKATDENIKARYGLPETLTLVEDDARTAEEAKEQWAQARAEVELRASRKRR
ncbi:hypothetical protein B0H14DRAFT_2448966, partial [Mycena olivaceomarginata]